MDNLQKLQEAINDLQQDIPVGRENAVTLDELSDLWSADFADTAKVVIRLIAVGDIQISFFREA